MKNIKRLLFVALTAFSGALLSSGAVAGIITFTSGQVLTASALNNNFSAVVPLAGGVTLTGPLTIPTLTVTGSLSLSSALAVVSGGTGVTSASGAALDNITGFSGTGLLTRNGAGSYSFTALSSLLQAANNLSDIGNSSTARTNLGLGTIATQSASAVALTGGTINGTTIGGTTPAAITASALNSTGAVALPVKTISASASTGAADFVVKVSASTGAVTYTLPSAASSTNRIVSVQKIDSSANAVTIAASGADTINGAASQAISTQWGAITLQSDGTTWTVIQTTLATLG
ncbi:hypothetical protein [Burkholderia vietnamiensis]|uniref:hypothetical protein n=1 Tax=Burkholderia vietnamiensis TaxID=60552 RepID=UPI001D138390|nr:hypothetical protein [Burkholderia vietnamiensis]UEC03983.1 hypothetical protein LK462_32365 [Burkholderia vietnamiensis]